MREEYEQMELDTRKELTKAVEDLTAETIGTVLKMIEEAGAIISTRHCNSQNGVGVWGPSASPARALRDPGSPLRPCRTLWGQGRSLSGAWAWSVPLPLP